MIKKCDLCEKQMKTKPSLLKKGKGKYCSLSCLGKVGRASQKRRDDGEHNPNWKGGASKRYYDSYVKQYKKSNPEKVKAHRMVADALKKGTLSRLPCQVCGAQKTDAHHEDYEKPLVVEWLCRSHHLERHNHPAHYQP